MTEPELDLFHGEARKAEPILAAAVTKDPKDDRSRMLHIQTLLREGKFDDVDKLVDEWNNNSPQNAYALLSAGQMHHSEGNWLEGYALMLKALSANPCLAEAYAGAANYESLAGFHATARKHLALAHALAPNNDSILLAWIFSLDLQSQPAELKQLLTESHDLTPVQRKDLALALEEIRLRVEHPCSLVAASKTVHIPMTPIFAGVGIESYGLEVSFNGHKRTLQIDTGASGFILSLYAASGLGLTQESSSAVGGVGSGGDTAIALSYAKSVEIGGVQFKNCAVQAFKSFTNMGGSAADGHLDDSPGLVGTDIFSRYMVTVDYNRHEIRLDPLPPTPGGTAPETLDALGGDPTFSSFEAPFMGDRHIAPSMKSWTSVFRDDHMLYIPTHLEKGTAKMFIMDTGAFDNIIDARTARTVTKQHGDADYVHGVSGLAKVGESDKLYLDFAGVRVNTKSMITMDMSRNSGVLGFIGYPVLSQLILHIDYRDNLLQVESPSAPGH